MMNAQPHLSPYELDLWLSGRLPPHRTSHLETCKSCRTAAEETRDLVLQLATLPAVPLEVSLADRVMAQVKPGVFAQHLTDEELDLWTQSSLPAAREGHLRSCPDCQRLADQERVLVHRLEALPLFASAPGFAERVLAAVDLPATSIAGAWRKWRRGVFTNPVGVGIAAGVGVFLGGSVAASAAWAAGNQDLITGTQSLLWSMGQQWLWQGIGMATAFLQQQGWYDPIRASLTPGRITAVAASIAGFYAGGLLALRRLLALPSAQVARAAQ